MQTIFRPKLWLWLRGNPLVLILAAALIPLLILEQFSALAGAICGVGCLLIALQIKKAISNFIAIDNRQISGGFHGQIFRVQWWDVRAAWLDDAVQGNPRLMLGTDQNLFAIPLRYMSAKTIWEMAQARINPAALREEARRDLPCWHPVNALEIPEPARPLEQHGRLLEKMIGWCGIAFFGGVLLAHYPQLGIGFELMLASFALCFGGFLLSTYYSLRISPAGITHQTLFGEFYIGWDELKSVMIAQDGSTVMFQGEVKQILVYGPRTWRKSVREDMMQYIGAQLEARQIQVNVDPWLGPRMAYSNRAARVKGRLRE